MLPNYLVKFASNLYSRIDSSVGFDDRFGVCVIFFFLRYWKYLQEKPKAIYQMVFKG